MRTQRNTLKGQAKKIAARETIIARALLRLTPIKVRRANGERGRI